MEKILESYFLSNNWKPTKKNKVVNKTFKFKSFKEAFSWMTEMAINAEVLNHHPEWTNVYNNIEVSLTTHDLNDISEKDLRLAKLMDSSFEKYY